MPITFFLEKVVGIFQSANPTNILGRTAMVFDKELIYSKRYPTPMEELEKFTEGGTQPLLSQEEIKESFQDFLDLMNGESHCEPIPGQEEKAQEFITLAREFSEEYEIDADIRRTPYSVEACLHFYCGDYGKYLTRQFARLFNLCDDLSSFVLKTEPSDFTLILEVRTHKLYRSGELMNDY